MLRILFLFWSFFLCVYSQGGQQPSYLFGGRNCQHLSNETIDDLIPFATGGRNVTEGEMPWMVNLNSSLVNMGTRLCGGFIVDQNLIVTAAHCIVGVVSVKVSTGRISYEWGSNSQHEQVMNVPITNLFIHPGYNSDTWLNDIGLIRLPRSLNFTRHVRPICILNENSCIDQPLETSSRIDYCDRNLQSAGWGMDETGYFSPHLKAVGLNSLSRRDCSLDYAPRRIYPQQLCARGANFFTDTCVGDSGGPLFCHQNGTPVAIGIVSFGPKYCGINRPAIYNRVCSHIGWMKNVVASWDIPNGCVVPARYYGNKVVQNGTSLTNGQILPTGSTVQMECVEGFVVVHQGRRSVCMADKTWVPPVSYCRRIGSSTARPTRPSSSPNPSQCSNPPSVENGVIFDGSNEIGSRRIVTCSDGYRISGSSFSITICQPTLQWTNPGRCERPNATQCPPNFNNSVVSPGSNNIGASRMVVCSDGFKISGSSIGYIYCLQSLQWTDPGICTEDPPPSTECPEPEGISNGQISSG